jgi:hypothetical protein
MKNTPTPISSKEHTYLTKTIQPFMRSISWKIDNLVWSITEYELNKLKEIIANIHEISFDTHSWNRVVFDIDIVKELEKQYHIHHLEAFQSLQKRAYSIYALEWIIRHNHILYTLWEDCILEEEIIKQEAIDTYSKYMDIMLDSISSSANRLWNIHKAHEYKKKLLEYGVPEKDIRGIPET